MKTVDFIVNPIAGGKDKRWVIASIKRYIDSRKFDPRIHLSEKPGDAGALARESDAEIVVAVGGDGTVSEVARELVGTDKVLGIIPCGSGDGLALHMGISRIPALAVRSLNAERVEAVDVAFLNGQPFFCTAGFGLDASVSMQFARSTRRGLMQYIALAWDEWRQYPVDTYTISTADERWSGKAVFVTIANANQWGNQARIAPMASLQDGMLDVIVVRPFNTLEIPELATRLMTGMAHTSHHFLHMRGTTFHIHRERAGAVHYDGDPFEAGTDFDLSITPGALNVLVPPRKGKKL